MVTSKTTGRKKRKKVSSADRILNIAVYAVLILLTACTLLPVLQVVTISLSPQSVVSKAGLHLFPAQITLDGYKKVFQYPLIWTGYLNTIIRTILGTGINVLLLILGAYPLSRKYLPNKKFWTVFIIFTMYFSGGMIPSYLLVSQVLHIKNTIWALVLPAAVSAYTLIIVRNFFMSIPDSLEESAKLDGANDFTILFQIIVPLSKSVLATVTLWGAVYHWNEWFNVMLYMKEESKYTLQYVLRKILLEGQIEDIGAATAVTVNTQTMKMATLVVSILPIIIIYPFVQKYFVKGVMIGAVKG